MSGDRESNPPVTLKTIAEELGVSITTVTRALNGGPKIGSDTIRRVKETAKNLGYVRNLDGVKLRTGNTFVIMALFGFNNEEEIGDSGSVGLLNGMHTRFSGSQYSVRAIPITIGDNGNEHVRKVVRGRNADGLVIDHTEPDDARVRYLLEKNVPFVTFGRTNMSGEHAFFDIDNEEAAYQGTSSLLDAGHERIALLEADPRFVFVQQRLRGYRRALSDHGKPVDEALISHTTLQADVASRTAATLLDLNADSFVCVNELMFLGARAGVMRKLGQGGLEIGFSVRSGTNIGDYVGTRVHVSHYSRLQAGWQLADLLLRRISGAPVKDCQKIVRTELRIQGGFIS